MLGFEEIPMAGDQLKVVEDEKKARQIAEQRKLKKEQMEKVSREFCKSFIPYHSGLLLPKLPKGYFSPRSLCTWGRTLTS